MPRKGHNEEQIMRALAQSKLERSVGRLQQGRRERSDLLLLEKEVRRAGVTELRELRQLREENGQMKRLVADLSHGPTLFDSLVSGVNYFPTRGSF